MILTTGFVPAVINITVARSWDSFVHFQSPNTCVLSTYYLFVSMFCVPIVMNIQWSNVSNVFYFFVFMCGLYTHFCINIFRRNYKLFYNWCEYLFHITLYDLEIITFINQCSNRYHGTSKIQSRYLMEFEIFVNVANGWANRRFGHGWNIPTKA